ncbi:MAG: M56 family metallopeptidase [Isosphaerales bacterium]
MLGWFAETTIVAAGLAVVATLVSRLRPVGPTVRHALWLVVLIKLMAPPLVSWPWAMPWRDLAWPITTPVAVHTAAVVDGTWPRSVSALAELTSRVGASEGISPTWTQIEVATATSRRAVIEVAPVQAMVEVPVAPRRSRAWWLTLLAPTALPRWMVSAWLAVSVVLGVGQSIRILRFRRRLREAVPAPDNLVEETERISRRLGVPVPELLVVPDLGTPLLWCLGRPQLLLPGRLVKTLAFDRWRGILTHELAHLRRLDHWVSRLELVAGLVWWWNPLYWLTRARLDAEAELACDAWVVWALPKDRLSYAEALFDICTLSLARPPAPTLGVAGSGRFFERRLTMILHDHVPCRLSPLGFLGACLLVLFALPSWSSARPAALDREDQLASTSIASTPDQGSAVSVADDDDEKVVKKDRDEDKVDAADDDADAADDYADDDDDNKPASRAKAKAKAKAEAKAKAKAKKPELDVDIDLSRIEKEIESKFGSGSDFEKKMEELGEKIGKEIEAKFGPDFEKKMEEFGKEMEAKFGPGSDFEKKMEEFGKEMEAKFGPGSDFEKKMKNLGKEMEAKFGPGSDFEKKIKELGAGSSSKMQTTKSKKPSSSKAQAQAAPAKAEAKAKDRKRERRIHELEAQIRKLVDEIKALKAEDRDESDER